MRVADMRTDRLEVFYSLLTHMTEHNRMIIAQLEQAASHPAKRKKERQTVQFNSVFSIAAEISIYVWMYVRMYITSCER